MVGGGMAAREGTAHAKRQNLDGMERQKCL